MVLQSDNPLLPEDTRPTFRQLLMENDLHPWQLVQWMLEEKRNITRERAIYVAAEGAGTVEDIDECLIALSDKLKKKYTRKTVGGFTFLLSSADKENAGESARTHNIPLDTESIYVENMRRYGAILYTYVHHPIREEYVHHPMREEKDAISLQKAIFPLGTHYAFKTNTSEFPYSIQVEVTFPNGYTLFTDMVHTKDAHYYCINSDREPGRDSTPLEALGT